MTDRRKVKRMMTVWIVLGAIAIVVGYGAFRAKDLAEGPQLSIESPENGSTATSSIVRIQGKAQNIAFLTMNGNKIFTDESGAFDEETAISSGYNMVTLEARDRFGRTVRKTLQLSL